MRYVDEGIAAGDDELRTSSSTALRFGHVVAITAREVTRQFERSSVWLRSPAIATWSPNSRPRCRPGTRLRSSRGLIACSSAVRFVPIS